MRGGRVVAASLLVASDASCSLLLAVLPAAGSPGGQAQAQAGSGPGPLPPGPPLARPAGEGHSLSRMDREWGGWASSSARWSDAGRSSRGVSDPGGHSLSTGFLDGTHPIVDSYELKVRLQHITRRCGILRDVLSSRPPLKIVDRLYLGDAVTSASYHLLRHVGVTHVINATQDLPLPELSEALSAVRFPLADQEDEAIGAVLVEATQHIQHVLADPRHVLFVHCHEGRSRSVTLVLAYLMKEHRMPLKAALAHVKQQKPSANPNGGYLQELVHLERELFGASSMRASRSKPTAKRCDICGASVGVSSHSVAMHKKLHHRFAETDGSREVRPAFEQVAAKGDIN